MKTPQVRCSLRQGYPFCFGCYANIKGTELHLGHLKMGVLRAPARSRVDMWVDVKRDEGPGTPAVQTQGVKDFAAAWPAVFEYMTLDRFPDGGARETATLLVFIEAGRVKGCLSDRECGRTLWATADTVDDVLCTLDEAIQSGSADWRVSRQRPPAKGKRS